MQTTYHRLMTGYQHARAMTAFYNRQNAPRIAAWWANVALNFLALARKYRPDFEAYARAMAGWKRASRLAFAAHLDWEAEVVPSVIAEAARRENFCKDAAYCYLERAAVALNPTLLA